MDIPSFNIFLKQVRTWADSQAQVLAAALVGSWARGSAKPDSDIDLVLIVENPIDFLEDTTWISRFGIPQNQQVKEYGAVTSLRVWYADGKEVEFGFTTPDWIAEPLDPGTRQVINAGCRVILDRSGNFNF